MGQSCSPFIVFRADRKPKSFLRESVSSERIASIVVKVPVEFHHCFVETTPRRSTANGSLNPPFIHQKVLPAPPLVWRLLFCFDASSRNKI